jgi:saccharopine dehydrogenase (NADP+, L-glutamate forming)/spermidine synthase
MSKALLLGAGLVARPLVRYLLDQGIHVTIASRTKSKADALLEGHPKGSARAWTVDDLDGLGRLVAEHDLAISLLPAPMHPVVAEACLKHRKHMVTTSYVSPTMKALDGRAREAGVILLNELGVDPGIDHMSAMRIIHHVQKSGGKITCFRSYCGGIPAPDANDNPWGYKFSWSPLAVLRAATNSARYLKNGQEVQIESKHLFLDTHHLPIEGIGELESYPNRDSMGYVDLYGLHGVSTMFRGTLRYQGWSETMRRIGEFGLLDQRERTGLDKMTWPNLLAEIIGAKGTQRIKERVAAHLWLPPDSPTITKLEWLGLFSEQKLPRERGSIIELLAEAMQSKMMYAEGEKDMIVMQHEFVADYGSRQERITSSLVDFGIPGGDSSMARTVSLPAAIAVRMILDGTIKDRGVHIPVSPSIYNPIMDELATLKIAMREKTYPL